MQFFLMRKAILCGACVCVCMWECVRLIHVFFVPYSVVHMCALNAVGSCMSNYSVLSVCVCVNVHV